ncbi:pteridine reductase [Lysobacteraceae bacterium NML120232]|nr:pteridine reductase [Xanthomonadaceae bacterium NML08-0793]PJK12349.1 pteridine reductase [Xanthomonadaceae bacterium NML120232]
MPDHPPVTLITGAAKRIGAAIARHLHGEGHCLALHYRSSAAAMQALIGELNATRPGSAIALQADLAEVSRIPALINQTIDTFGRLDLLINNASGYYATPVGTVTPEDWDTLFASNARAPFFLSQAAALHLRQARGAIINIVDIYAERPLPGHPVYCMAKAALAMMTRALAVELGPEVRVNGIAPGNILWSENPQKAETLEMVEARTTLRRQGCPEDIAQMVSQLYASAYVSGQIIAVDGGRSLYI